eukprot:3430738-Pleurochrysis_carterae.AAC.1
MEARKRSLLRRHGFGTEAAAAIKLEEGHKFEHSDDDEELQSPERHDDGLSWSFSKRKETIIAKMTGERRHTKNKLSLGPLCCCHIALDAAVYRLCFSIDLSLSATTARLAAFARSAACHAAGADERGRQRLCPIVDARRMTPAASRPAMTIAIRFEPLPQARERGRVAAPALGVTHVV